MGNDDRLETRLLNNFPSLIERGNRDILDERYRSGRWARYCSHNHTDLSLFASTRLDHLTSSSWFAEYLKRMAAPIPLYESFTRSDDMFRAFIDTHEVDFFEISNHDANPADFLEDILDLILKNPLNYSLQDLDRVIPSIELTAQLDDGQNVHVRIATYQPLVDSANRHDVDAVRRKIEHLRHSYDEIIRDYSFRNGTGNHKGLDDLLEKLKPIMGQKKILVTWSHRVNSEEGEHSIATLLKYEEMIGRLEINSRHADMENRLDRFMSVTYQALVEAQRGKGFSVIYEPGNDTHVKEMEVLDDKNKKSRTSSLQFGITPGMNLQEQKERLYVCLQDGKFDIVGYQASLQYLIWTTTKHVKDAHLEHFRKAAKGQNDAEYEERRGLNDHDKLKGKELYRYANSFRMKFLGNFAYFLHYNQWVGQRKYTQRIYQEYDKFFHVQAEQLRPEKRQQVLDFYESQKRECFDSIKRDGHPDISFGHEAMREVVAYLREKVPYMKKATSRQAH